MVSDNKMGSFAHPIFWQVRQLIKTLNEKNYKAQVQELQQLSHLRSDVSMYYLSCLISEVNPPSDKDALKIQLLEAEFKERIPDAEFGALVYDAL